MAKKSSKGRVPARAAAAAARGDGGGAAAAAAAPNAFERLHSKKRFDVVGRRDKAAAARSAARLRTEAAEKRKDTLLVEYRALRKSNAFVDRRFGEGDEGLTPDERALLRFQKQRARELAGSRFALPDDDGGGGERLTHLGRSLAEVLEEEGGGGPPGWGSDDDDDDRRRGGGGDLTAELNFGGGLFERAPPRGGGGDADGGGAAAAPRSRKEVMAEVVAKSKAHKAARQRQREDDASAAAALDAAFRELAGAAALAPLARRKGERAPPGADGGAGGKTGDEDGDRRYDVLAKELLYEARATPGERTLPPEELAALEAARLEAAEAARLRRQRAAAGAPGGDDLDDDDGGGAPAAAAPAGGYAARRAKRRRLEEERAARAGGRAGSDSDGSGSGSGSESDGDDDGGKDDVAGLTKLELRRRQRAAGADPLQQAFRDASKRLLSRHGGGEEEDEEDDEDSEDGTGSESGEDDDGSGGSSGEESGSESGSEPEEGEEAGPAAPAPRAPQPPAADAGAVLDMTFTPALPASAAELAAAAAGLPPAALGELVARIRAFHARALGSAADRRPCQLLYAALVQHFVSLCGGGAPSPAHADVLVPHIVALTSAVPFYAAALARARLDRAHAALAAALRAGGAGAWPPPRALALLKLLALAFPPTDARHPVLTPAGLYACAALGSCPLVAPRDAGLALALAALATHLHSGARRWVPEPLGAAAAVLRAALPGGLLAAAAPAAGPAAEGDVAPLELRRVLAAPPEDPYWATDGFKASAVAAAARLLERTAEVHADCDALPEALAPALAAAAAVAAAPAAAVPRGLAALVGGAAARARAAAAAAAAARRPLACAAAAAAPERRAFNPRFEDDYASGKDFDPDRERSARRRLQRAVRREERGAMRELRRDGAFMAAARDAERGAEAAARDASAKRAVAFLQAQQADARSGGQGGMWKRKRK